MTMPVDFSVGNLLTIVTMIVGSVIFLTRFRTDIQILVTRLDRYEKEFTDLREDIKKFANAHVDMAKQETRTDALEKRLDEGMKVREQMQIDSHARFEGLEARLRAVEARSHDKGRSNVVQVVPTKKRARGRS